MRRGSARERSALQGVAGGAAGDQAFQAEGLLKLAEQQAARMLVVGTHGERPLIGAILGSVPSRLLHRSRVPVLVSPHPPDRAFRALTSGSLRG